MTDGTDSSNGRSAMGDDAEPSLVSYENRPLYVGHVVWDAGSSEPTSLHRHPHHELTIARGSATLLHDFDDVPLSGTAAILMAPGALHRWTVEGPLELWVVGISPGSVPQRSSQITDLSTRGLVAIPDHEADDLFGLLRLAKRRFEEAPDRPGLVANYVQALLDQLTAWASADRPRPGDRDDDLAGRFIAAIASFDRRRTVGEHASALGVSPGHLATVVRARTGRAPKDLIAQRLVLEAKRRLAHGNDSAAAIGRQLGFVDASQFGRWFQRHTAETPGGFRASVRQARQVDRAASETVDR
ncbi:MAG: helix-turn-helix transcriptional regulator [Actinomycetota bacterium]